MSGTAAPVRVLYVDDDAGLCRLVRRHLERDGFTVTTATDGEAGLALARAETFDAIALDHYMPGRDGLDLMADLLGLPDAPPVIFVTAAEEPIIAVTALKHGAYDYVVKDLHGTFMEFLATSIRQSQTQVRLERERATALRELQESRDRLEVLANQRALLLREVNHRIANSLQLISSLIELQARKLADPAAQEALRRAAERMDAVSLVHRRLYTSDDVEHVAMDQYLAGLMDELRRAVADEDRTAELRLDAEPIRVETDRAVAIGLIVNELVTNALKYAYPSGSGEIRVRLRRLGGVMQLAVEDDGVGHPADPTPKGSGLGSTIVSAMARQVHATVTVHTGADGTRVTLDAPLLMTPPPVAPSPEPALS